MLRNPPSPGAGSALSRSRSREGAMPAVPAESCELGHAAHSPPSTELSSCKDKQGEHCSGRCAGQNVCAGPGAANVLAGLKRAQSLKNRLGSSRKGAKAALCQGQGIRGVGRGEKGGPLFILTTSWQPWGQLCLPDLHRRSRAPCTQSIHWQHTKTERVLVAGHPPAPAPCPCPP